MTERRKMLALLAAAEVLATANCSLAGMDVDDVLISDDFDLPAYRLRPQALMKTHPVNAKRGKIKAARKQRRKHK